MAGLTRNRNSLIRGCRVIVRKKGLEPPRREAPDPKSGAATNYATSAVRMYLFRIAKIDIVSKTQNCFKNILAKTA